MPVEYLHIRNINGPLLVIEGLKDASFEEMVEIIVSNKESRLGRIIDIHDDKAVIQVFEGTSDISVNNASVRLKGRPMELPVSPEILGRIFDGAGRPIDGLGKVSSKIRRDINGRPINPVSRKYPRNYIETGISAIDCMTTLICGQKLPIFSGNGLPHNELAAQIVKQAKLKGTDNNNFAIVFAAMGVKHDVAEYFRESFEQSGAMSRVVMFLNLAQDPTVERIITPRCALTAAEYLAFSLGMHILVILTDMTAYCEALREISSSRGEVPGRKGFPGYMYSDLASIYERAGMIKNKKGSITQIPILTMPNDDITHPVPDLTGFITEGQIVLERGLAQRGIYPPISVLPSLSRLMKDSIGEGFTREDHPQCANQLFASYAHVQEVKALASIIGEEELSEIDKLYMEFGRAFENQFLAQDFNEERTIIETLDLAWQVLNILPKEELDRVEEGVLERYFKQKACSMETG